MQRLACKTDGNQKSIVQTFRQAGASVLVLSAVGKGCADLLVGYKGINLFVEVKSKKGKFTPDQIEFIVNWRGKIHVVRSCLQAVELLNNSLARSGLNEKCEIC